MVPGTAIQPHGYQALVGEWARHQNFGRQEAGATGSNTALPASLLGSSSTAHTVAREYKASLFIRGMRDSLSRLDPSLPVHSAASVVAGCA